MRNVFERLDLRLSCRSGQPASLKVADNEHNTKGQFRLIPRGTGRPDAGKVHLRTCYLIFVLKELTFTLSHGRDTHPIGRLLVPASSFADYSKILLPTPPH